MANFLRNFDSLSFWMGFLAGSLLWWLLGKLRPLLGSLLASLRNQVATTREGVMLGSEIRLGNDTLRHVQQWHIASPLFSLDEILIPPRLLAPPAPPTGVEEIQPVEDITDWAIPYMPDWPELASYYGAPTLTLAEALQGGANLALIGQPGIGKTVALAHLATLIIRHDPGSGEFANHIPLLVNVSDLILPPREQEDLLATLIDAISEYTSTLTSARLPRLLDAVINQNRALLLLDGLDELSPPLVESVIEYLENLLHQYPTLQTVATAAPEHIDGLLPLGFFPIPLASWDEDRRRAFIQRWGALWTRFVATSQPETPGTADPFLLNGWLFNNTALLTPLELTLKVWAAYAGDSLGPSSRDAIEAYLRRMTHEYPAAIRSALERLATQMILTMQPVADRKDAEGWVSEYDLPISSNSLDDFADDLGVSESDASKREDRSERISASSVLPDLIESSLVASRPGGRLCIVQPIITGYLAGHSLAQSMGGNQIVTQPKWVGRSTTLRYIAAIDRQAPWINGMLEEENIDPLLDGILTVSRWLNDAPEKTAWVSGVMRQLASSLQNDTLAFGLRTRLLTALAISGNKSVSILFRQLLTSPQNAVRQLAALGSGVLRDTKAVNEISILIEDPSPNVNRASFLALAAIGNKLALESVAYGMLHGDDGLRRAAAEALANHPEEGHPTLEEGSTLEDPAVRRAAVFGLARVKRPWATEILEKMRADDSQWVVQDAAIQVLETTERPNTRIPKNLPPLTETPWLIAFAGERGMGVAPGKPANDLLYLAIREGKEEQQLAALYYLSRNGDESALLPLYQVYFSDRGEMREAALNALWHLSASGMDLPPPIQYGLK